MKTLSLTLRRTRQSVRTEVNTGSRTQNNKCAYSGAPAIPQGAPPPKNMALIGGSAS